jgi:hypothetical protein
LTLFNEEDRPSKDTLLASSLAAEHIRIGGCVVYAHLQDGFFEQVNEDGTPLNSITTNLGDQIQDVVLMENRDRKYRDDVVKLYGAYTVSQNALDFARFGLMLSSDIVQMEFHKGEMEQFCGRRILPGDVIEMSHMRDVGTDGIPTNRWYEVRSIVKSPRGYDNAYQFHILAVTMRPLQNAQEFADLMNRVVNSGGGSPDATLGDQSSTAGTYNDITATIQNSAFEQAYTTWWDTTPVYIDPDTTDPYKWTDDAKPPNGLPVTVASSFPSSPTEGEYLIRTDFTPNKLYRFQDNIWVFKELDRKREWNTYNWLAKMREFMSDQSEADDARPWKLVSIHDVLTPRQNDSHPAPRGDGNYEQLPLPPAGSWTPIIIVNYPDYYSSTSEPSHNVILSNDVTDQELNTNLNFVRNAYKIVHVQYTASRGANSRMGEFLIDADGTSCAIRHEFDDLVGDVGLDFSVAYDANILKIYYSTTNTGTDINFSFKIKDRW